MSIIYYIFDLSNLLPNYHITRNGSFLKYGSDFEVFSISHWTAYSLLLLWTIFWKNSLSQHISFCSSKCKTQTAYFMAGENVGCKSWGKSKFITVIILNIFFTRWRKYFGTLNIRNLRNTKGENKLQECDNCEKT